jgi:glutathione peroxidase
MAAMAMVNGPKRHPRYKTPTATSDEEGLAREVRWNFEKFLVSADGRTVARFLPAVEPESRALTDAIESELPS